MYDIHNHVEVRRSEASGLYTEALLLGTRTAATQCTADCSCAALYRCCSSAMALVSIARPQTQCIQPLLFCDQSCACMQAECPQAKANMEGRAILVRFAALQPFAASYTLRSTPLRMPCYSHGRIVLLSQLLCIPHEGVRTD